MDEDDRAPIKAPDAVPDTPVSYASTKRARRKWPFVVVGVLVVLPVAVFAAWAAIAMQWSYSEGTRSGYMQKFSRKGWLCKTWEGEIAMVNMPGAAQERWTFSVRDDDVAAQINKLMGARVALSYAQHVGVPGTCFGETEYFITSVKLVQ